MSSGIEDSIDPLHQRLNHPERQPSQAISPLKMPDWCNPFKLANKGTRKVGGRSIQTEAQLIEELVAEAYFSSPEEAQVTVLQSNLIMNWGTG